MFDPWVTREMQVRDLLIHNSGLGLGAGDLMLWPEPNSFSRADVIAGIAYLKPTHSFRSNYAYDNTLYIVAGEVAAAAGGAPYEVLMQREVFAPLEARRAARRAVSTSKRRRQRGAAAHAGDAGKNVPIRLDQDRFVPSTLTSAAAGGIRCSLDDMLAWAKAWLVPNDWLSPEQRAAVWTPHMPMPLSAQATQALGGRQLPIRTATAGASSDANGQLQGRAHRHVVGHVFLSRRCCRKRRPAG